MERTFWLLHRFTEIHAIRLANLFDEVQNLLRRSLVDRMEVNYFRKHPGKQSIVGYVVHFLSLPRKSLINKQYCRHLCLGHINIRHLFSHDTAVGLQGSN